ncbi:MAG: hypothetical protein UU58_C0006G0021 [Candidatus Nomurabacteria bacterium GW2011_GWA2_41_25]|uniref:EfeO-type cupredoxin-like domain-containing protein n=2 Tax=Candidatus Nomuraibacteriota TaxID=1752729 RepID=A0A1F6YAC7_9BACT|nr:MAG: hypothetical protein UU58_C0006G0021 [Candidatus Nomurabacteria bacterium GW2011_GWA2_41_25]OGI66577.1 MAG: hypothetical protein A2823_00475 [Candidatus Nomurabacteria bacterium RIFCSPHIGHO2_01_FULL_41_91]OGI80723.1 MAG: hypothetical protein A3D43_02510 [Candidatus Nomurabacteria bacterium RIFCSPHIGHO2_02_FULL_41_52]OGI84625.1 MAG: hypothetical protein A3F49_02185 [Candidatus Nomurabacteria bacterium RIFCSPHIGHO2_12_FULL_42_19]OGI94004.1 MAG: hypothetical protein A3A07_00755 [Candidatus
MNKTVLIIITLGLIVVMGIIFTGESDSESAQNNIEIRNGIQYITINAKGGYSPGISAAKAGIPTKLIVKTESTYDCSAALVIRSVNFQKILPQTGETEIDLGIPKAGEPLQGICGMGMYSFQINFGN